MLQVVFPAAAHSPGTSTGSRRRGWRRRSVRLAVALITVIYALVVAPVRPAAAAAEFDDWVWISAPDGKKCLGLDSRYDNRADMALVALRECDFAESLYWRRVEVWGSAAEFQNYYSGKCLDIAGASTALDAAAVQYRCWGGTTHDNSNQQWMKFTVRDGSEHLDRLVNWNSYLCLTRTGSTVNSVVVQRGCAANDPANEWSVEPAPWPR